MRLALRPWQTTTLAQRKSFEAHRIQAVLAVSGRLATRSGGLARRNFILLEQNAAHPSLQFKTVGSGKYCSVRVGLYYRALGLPVPDGVHWFWIGTHGEYDKIVG